MDGTRGYGLVCVCWMFVSQPTGSFVVLALSVRLDQSLSASLMAEFSRSSDHQCAWKRADCSGPSWYGTPGPSMYTSTDPERSTDLRLPLEGPQSLHADCHPIGRTPWRESGKWKWRKSSGRQSFPVQWRCISCRAGCPSGVKVWM